MNNYPAPLFQTSEYPTFATFLFQVSFFLGWAFFTNPLDRLGLFTLGCCPGGTMSNFWTLMFNGDINLSITMTAVSTMAAMGEDSAQFKTLDSVYFIMPLVMVNYGGAIDNNENNDMVMILLLII